MHNRINSNISLRSSIEGIPTELLFTVDSGGIRKFVDSFCPITGNRCRSDCRYFNAGIDGAEDGCTMHNYYLAGMDRGDIYRHLDNRILFEKDMQRHVEKLKEVKKR